MKPVGKRGFTIIEIVIAGGLTMMLAYALMQIWDLQRKIVVTTESNLDTIDLVNQIRGTLGEPESCSKSFSGLLLSGQTATKITRAYQPPGGAPFVYSDLYEVGKLIGSVKIKSIKVRGSGAVPFDGNGVAEIEIERFKKGVMGGQTLVREIPLKITPDASSTSIVGCYAVTANSLSVFSICQSMGGTYNTSTSQCEGFADGLVDTTSTATCGSGSRYKLSVVAGKIRVDCTPCTWEKIFSRFSCTKNIPGKNWINTCYYKTVCAEDHAAIIEAEAWDGQAGPTSASGGDTGSESNCYQKRKKCALEP